VSKREQVAKSTTKRKAEMTEGQNVKGVDTQALTDEMDALLDEIDSVLEENAQEFIDQFVQKGGE
jgi:ubiquitin-like protein Pup